MNKTMTAPGRLLHDLASNIRELYILAYRDFRQRRTGVPCDYGCKPIPHWDGGVDRSGRRHRRVVWYDLARFALDRQVEPNVLVRATFDAFLESQSPDPPYPPTMMGPEADARIAAFAHQWEQKAGMALDLQNDTFATKVTVRQALDGETIEQAGIRVLNDPLISLSALYRYCLAAKAGLPDVVARFEEAAFAQYVYTRDAYDATWGDLIPPGLRAAAAAFHSDMQG